MFFLGWFFKSFFFFRSAFLSYLTLSVMSLTSFPWQFPQAAPTLPRCLDGQAGRSWFRLVTQNMPVEANRPDLLSTLGMVGYSSISFPLHGDPQGLLLSQLPSSVNFVGIP